jgi:hypothetical protein
MAPELSNAPPVTVVDGLTAVPIDFQSVTATLAFDAAARTAALDAEVAFTMGAADGNPVFDLRQPIDSAVLNGAAVPPAQLAHHDFGGGPGAELRIVERTLAAGSANTLSLHAPVGTPASPSAQPIGFDAASTRLYFDFWFSDLWPGRYLEMWLPANLIYDHFPVDLTVRIDNSGFDHLLFANGAVTSLGTNHWRIQYPGRYTALSHMLVIAAADRVQVRNGTVSLTGTGPVALETFKLTGTAADLAAVESNLQTWLPEFVASTGPYIHGNRFTTFVWSNPSRAMEYDGGTTSNVGSLKHEAFHSWYARGVKPATQNDAWLDEGWTVYNTGGSPFGVQAFNMADPPVTLAGRNPFSRVTAGNAYTDGSRFFAGLAAVLGVAQLRALMAELYGIYAGAGMTTADVEAHLIARTGRLEIADLFHRFVYGFATPPAGARPDLWLRDAPGDPGENQFAGTFWDPAGTVGHQQPEFGQDNYFHARVRNRGAATARHFVVTFNVKPWAGTEFVWPGDFLPCVAVAVGFDLPAGADRVVKARWPAAAGLPAGTHACWVTAAYTPGDPAPGGAHVWEHNNLAQKNLTVVDLMPGDSAIVRAQVGNLATGGEELVLELRRPKRWPGLRAELVEKDPRVLERLTGRVVIPPRGPDPPRTVVRALEPATVEVARPGSARAPVRLRLGRDSTLDVGPDVRDDAGTTARFARAGAPPEIARGGKLAPRLPEPVALRVSAPADARPGDELDLDLVQRRRDGQVVGGVRVRIRVV